MDQQRATLKIIWCQSTYIRKSNQFIQKIHLRIHFSETPETCIVSQFRISNFVFDPRALTNGTNLCFISEEYVKNWSNYLASHIFFKFSTLSLQHHLPRAITKIRFYDIMENFSGIWWSKMHKQLVWAMLILSDTHQNHWQSIDVQYFQHWNQEIYLTRRRLWENSQTLPVLHSSKIHKSPLTPSQSPRPRLICPKQPTHSSVFASRYLHIRHNPSMMLTTPTYLN